MQWGKRFVALMLVLVMTGAIVGPVSAWGGLTHYSIARAVDDR